MIDEYGHFIDIDIDTNIDIDCLYEDLYYYKKKLSNDNIVISYNNRPVHNNNKINFIILSILSIVTYYVCYTIHLQNY